MYASYRVCFCECLMTGVLWEKQNEDKGITVSGSNNLKTVERVDDAGKPA